MTRRSKRISEFERVRECKSSGANRNGRRFSRNAISRPCRTPVLFTLRSVPHHFDGIKAAIESTGEARVYFGEPLAYIRGQGVALFRVEATGFSFLKNLFDWWTEAERENATGFDIRLYSRTTSSWSAACAG